MTLELQSRFFEALQSAMQQFKSYPKNGRISTNRLKEQTGDNNNIYNFL